VCLLLRGVPQPLALCGLRLLLTYRYASAPPFVVARIDECSCPNPWSRGNCRQHAIAAICQPLMRLVEAVAVARRPSLARLATAGKPSDLDRCRSSSVMRSLDASDRGIADLAAHREIAAVGQCCIDPSQQAPPRRGLPRRRPKPPVPSANHRRRRATHQAGRSRSSGCTTSAAHCRAEAVRQLIRSTPKVSRCSAAHDRLYRLPSRVPCLIFNTSLGAGLRLHALDRPLSPRAAATSVVSHDGRRDTKLLRELQVELLPEARSIC